MAEQFDKVQVLFLGGWVLDVSPEAWELLRPEMTTSAEIEVEDIYGCTCWFRTDKFVGARHWTLESGERYRALHADDEEEGDGG